MNPEIESLADLLPVPAVEDKKITRTLKRRIYNRNKKNLTSFSDKSRISTKSFLEGDQKLLKRRLNLSAKKTVVQTLKSMKEVEWARDAQYYDYFGTPDVDYVLGMNGAINTELFVQIVTSRAERSAYIAKFLADETEEVADPFAYLLERKIVILLGTHEARIKEKLLHAAKFLQKT